jgi:tetratricopeptide (TPR) repeat protein
MSRMHNLVISAWLTAVLYAGDAPAPSIVIERDASPVATPVHPLDSGGVRVRPSVRLGQEDICGKLAVQNAIRQSRQRLDEGRYAEAADILESCLDRAGGCADYLEALETAYRAQLSDLVAQGKSKDASIVARKLRSLGVEAFQPAARATASLGGPIVAADDEPAPLPAGGASVAAPPAPVKELAEESGVAAPAKRLGQSVAESFRSLIPRAGKSTESPREPAFQFRGKMEESESLTPAADYSEAPACCPELARAMQLFDAKQYPAALAAYEKAYQADPNAVQPQRARWGYCLLCATIERYNRLIEGDLNAVDPAAWQDLKADAERVRRLAPSIAYTETVLAAISDRIQESTRRFHPAAPTNVAMQAYAADAPREGVGAVDVRHHTTSDGLWRTSETRNFILYHRDPRLAEEVGALAERARQYAYALWFKGERVEDWRPKCELFLYPTAHEYGVSTGVGPQSPGHSKVVNSGGTILSRKVLLRVDDPSMKEAVLPHEVAHVVFAGRFGPHTLPRWADEGMAVLTEPIDKQNAHLANLCRCQATGRGFSCQDVMTMGQYPAGEAMRDFYAHSVGICRYLVERHGHEKLVAFLRAALSSGNYDAALAQVYGMSSFSQIESDFRGYVASLGGNAVALAQ